MDRCADEDYAAACCVGVLRRGEEVRESGFESVVGAEDVDVDDGFHGVGGKLRYGGEEVACCAGSASLDTLAYRNAGQGTVTYIT